MFMSGVVCGLNQDCWTLIIRASGLYGRIEWVLARTCRALYRRVKAIPVSQLDMGAPWEDLMTLIRSRCVARIGSNAAYATSFAPFPQRLSLPCARLLFCLYSNSKVLGFYDIDIVNTLCKCAFANRKAMEVLDDVFVIDSVYLENITSISFVVDWSLKLQVRGQVFVIEGHTSTYATVPNRVRVGDGPWNDATDLQRLEQLWTLPPDAVLAVIEVFMDMRVADQ